MRRPLFLVCLCLVLTVWCGTVRIGDGAVPDSSATVPEETATEAGWSGLSGSCLTATGQVCQKDTEYFYLDSIILEQDAAVQQQTIPFTEKLMCEYPEYADDTEVLHGSTVKVSGIFDAFSQATNPGEFDMASYYHSLEIGGKLREVSILEGSVEYSRWKESLYGIRKYFHGRLYEVFPEKEASIMCTMLLGEKKGLDSEVKALYQRNGIVHILSISGLHITIIGMGIYRMLRRAGVPVWLAAVLGGSILLLYGVMTGLSVSSVRAIGMYLLRLLSEVVGRTYDMLTALGIMAAVVVWSHPGYLGNAGFYLSFGAVLGVGVLYPALLPAREACAVPKYEGSRWKQLAGKMAGKLGGGLKQSMFAGLSVTLITLPVQLWFYYEVPAYSLFLNLLVLPFMGVVMLAGLLAMLVPGLGILGTVDCLILGAYERLCQRCELLPFHTWNPGQPEKWQMMVYYLILLGIAAVSIGKMGRTRRKRAAGRILQTGILTMAVIVLTCHFPEGTTVIFLDVGQGDCICVQTASGEVYLFDCGSSSRSKAGQYVLKPYLKYCGISHIDAVFVSHSDSDHCNGVEELLTQGAEWGITVGQVVWPGDIRAGDSWWSGIGDASTSDTWWNGNGDALSSDTCQNGSGDIRFTCLHPSAEGTVEDTNADSQCFYIELQNGISILLTGDVEGAGEESLLQELQKRQIEQVSVLKVAHHGSRNATSEELLRQIQPQAAVISCGKNNRYGHPHEELLERLEACGAKTLITCETGAVTLHVERKNAWVEKYLP